MKERILIMEDETAIQSVLYELLTDAGYEVSLASDGLEGISLFQSQSFSLILLDIMMPKIDGYAVCEFIRKKVPDSDYHAYGYGRRRSTNKSF